MRSGASTPYNPLRFVFDLRFSSIFRASLTCNARSDNGMGLQSDNGMDLKMGLSVSAISL